MGGCQHEIAMSTQPHLAKLEKVGSEPHTARPQQIVRDLEKLGSLVNVQNSEP